jgi:uncharacterized protein involved in type VI secretion and phage assembly
MAIHHGVLIGVVEDLKDPKGLGRVRVSFPRLNDEMSDWIRLSLPMAGAGRGTFFRPEKGDEVLLACEQGDIRQPYVLGSLWSKKDSPPGRTGAATDNHIRVIVSRSGHRITLDDTPNSERIEIVDHAGKQAVLVDGSSVTVRADAGKVTITASGDVTVSAGGDLNLTAKKAVVISGRQVKIN